MKIDGRALLKRLEAEKQGDRGRVSLYLSKSLYEAFKKACGDIPASVVMEELMRKFVFSVKGPKG